MALLEPGILARSDDFIEFAKRVFRNSRPQPSPFELREMYSRDLGKITYLRGMSLTDAELMNILENGMDPPRVRHGLETYKGLRRKIAIDGVPALVESQAGRSMIENMLGWEKISGFRPRRDWLADSPHYLATTPRLARQRGVDHYHLISVSNRIDSAVMMAHISGSIRTQQSGVREPDRKEYVFKLTVPRIDTIRGNSFESWVFNHIARENISHQPAGPYDLESGRPSLNDNFQSPDELR